MKRFWCVLLAIVFSLVIYIGFYINSYKIDSSKESVQQYLTELSAEREDYRGSAKRIFMLNQVEDTTTWIAKFQFENGDYGSAEFVKGWNRKFKFVSSNNQPYLTYKLLYTNKGRYGAVSGINEDGKISKIKMTTSSEQNYIIDIPKDIIFTWYVKLPESLDGTDPVKYVLYDNDDSVIETY